jgi:hypothetical protein
VKCDSQGRLLLPALIGWICNRFRLAGSVFVVRLTASTCFVFFVPPAKYFGAPILLPRQQLVPRGARPPLHRRRPLCVAAILPCEFLGTFLYLFLCRWPILSVYSLKAKKSSAPFPRQVSNSYLEEHSRLCAAADRCDAKHFSLDERLQNLAYEMETMLKPEDDTLTDSTRNVFSGTPDSRFSGGPYGAFVSPLMSPLHESLLAGRGGSGSFGSSPAIRSFASPLRMTNSPLKPPEPLWQGRGALSPLKLGGSTHSSESELLKLGHSRSSKWPESPSRSKGPVNSSGSFSDSPGRLPGVQTGVHNRTWSDSGGSSGSPAVRRPGGGGGVASPFGRSASFHEVDYTAMEDRKHAEAVAAAAGILEPGLKEREGSPSSGDLLSLIWIIYSTDYSCIGFWKRLDKDLPDAIENQLRPHRLLNVCGLGKEEAKCTMALKQSEQKQATGP